MNYQPFVLIEKQPHCGDTFVYQFRPQHGEIPRFNPGQFVFFKNPKSVTPVEEHPFSIASSPVNQHYFEFCIKVIGDWTSELTELTVGDTIQISAPQGSFVWDDTVTYAAFLLGGVGISPIMSMLRYLVDSGQHPEVVMIYGNRNYDCIAYQKELEKLQKSLSLKIVYVLSHLPEHDPWKGYRGFITQSIIKTEVNLSKKPVFFVVGPPIFLEHMQNEMRGLNLPAFQYRAEYLVDKNIQK
jgi:ferredoxin-NADP reductase